MRFFNTSDSIFVRGILSFVLLWTSWTPRGKVTSAFQPKPPSRPPPMDLLMDQTRTNKRSSLEQFQLSEEARRTIEYIENVGQFCRAMHWTLEDYEYMIEQLKRQQVNLRERTDAIDSLLFKLLGLEQDGVSVPILSPDDGILHNKDELQNLMHAVKRVLEVEGLQSMQDQVYQEQENNRKSQQELDRRKFQEALNLFEKEFAEKQAASMHAYSFSKLSA